MLMYAENENRVFAPWTPDHGGGPPCLWEFEGHLYAHRWQEPNVNFLKRILAVKRVGEVLAQAVERLVGQPEHDAAALQRPCRRTFHFAPRPWKHAAPNCRKCLKRLSIRARCSRGQCKECWSCRSLD